MVLFQGLSLPREGKQGSICSPGRTGMCLQVREALEWEVHCLGTYLWMLFFLSVKWESPLFR